MSYGQPYLSDRDTPALGQRLVLLPSQAMQGLLGEQSSTFFQVQHTRLSVERLPQTNKWRILPQQVTGPSDHLPERVHNLYYGWSSYLTKHGLGQKEFTTPSKALRALQRAFDKDWPSFDNHGLYQSRTSTIED